MQLRDLGGGVTPQHGALGAIGQRRVVQHAAVGAQLRFADEAAAQLAEWLAAGKPVVQLPGHSLERVVQAVLSVFPLALDLPQPAAYMQHSELPTGQTTAAQAAFIRATARAEGLPAERVEAIERFAFYERVKAASLIVQSGEATAYGNAILCKGVILPPTTA